MAKLDNIINSKIFFICEKNKESVSIKNQVAYDFVLDDDYLEKIKKLLKKKKNAPLEAEQELDLFQVSMKEYRIFSHMTSTALRSLKLASSKSDSATVLRMAAENAAQRNTSLQDIEKHRNAYTAVYPMVMKKKPPPSFSTENNLRKEIPFELSSATLLTQEKKALIQEDNISVKPDINVQASLLANKKDRKSEIPQVSLPLENHFSAEMKAVPISESPTQPSQTTLRTPFNLPENMQVASEKTLVSEGNNRMIYHFNKWQGSNSVRIQWDQKDKHQIYLKPSNRNVLHHISDRIMELPPKLKVVLQEEQQHSRQGNPNENREDKKGKR